MTMAKSAYDCTKPGRTRLDELHRGANDVARLSRFAWTIAQQCARASTARPGDGAGGVVLEGEPPRLIEGATQESIAADWQAAQDEVVRWWADWEPAVDRLSGALRIAPPAHLHLDLRPAVSALGQLIELFPKPIFTLPGERPGEHLLRSANPFGVSRDGSSNFPFEAGRAAQGALSSLVTTLQPFQRDGYEWDDNGADPNDGKRRLSKPAGWTQSELINEAIDAGAGLSDTKFRRIREVAGLKPSLRGGQGQQRRYSNRDIRQLCKAAETDVFRKGKQLADVWRGLVT